MDSTLDTLTALLLDPFLTCGEAEREAVAYHFAIPAPTRMSKRSEPTPTDELESDSNRFTSC